MAGLYIHIPFCASRCIYCGFYSTVQLQRRHDYVDALIAEMHLRPTADEIETIYLGGGTPSVLDDEDLKRLFDSIYNIYNVRAEAEVTMECNPEDITIARARHIASLPVNRVSMGVQTLCDERLSWLHRRHDSQQVSKSVRRLRDAGIQNISLDLIYGFPNQSVEEWEHDINALLALEPNHISAYTLMYEEGTLLYRMLEEGNVAECPEETTVKMYESLVRILKLAGFEHYEISNFALPGFRSRHNSSYWQDKPYIGLGAAAHSYDIRTRSWNVSNINDYISAIRSGIIPAEHEEIDELTHYNDLVTTQLRTREGMSLELLSPTLSHYATIQAEPFVRMGEAVIEDGRIHLTEKGIMVSDNIMRELIYIKEQ